MYELLYHKAWSISVWGFSSLCQVRSIRTTFNSGSWLLYIWLIIEYIYLKQINSPIVWCALQYYCTESPIVLIMSSNTSNSFARAWHVFQRASCVGNTSPKHNQDSSNSSAHAITRCADLHAKLLEVYIVTDYVTSFTHFVAILVYIDME